LKSSWPPGAEHAARGRDRSAEARRPQESGIVRVVAVTRQHAGKTGIVHIRDAQNVCHVEKVEDLGHRFKPDFFAQFKRFRQPEIEGIEAVAETRIVAHERQQLPCSGVDDAPARIHLANEVIEFRARVE